MSPRIIDVLMYIGQNYMNKNMGRGDMKYSQWNKLKSKKLKDCGYTCSKCGLQNSKLNFERVSEDYIISCRACNIIMNCKLSNLNEIVLCYSKKTQEYIVKKTIDYIKQNNDIPPIKKIDKNAKKMNISLVEYLDLVNSKKIHTINKNYKVFFTKYFSYDFLDDLDENLFTEETETDEDSANYELNLQNENWDINLPEYKFTDKELRIFTNHFNSKKNI